MTNHCSRINLVLGLYLLIVHMKDPCQSITTDLVSLTAQCPRLTHTKFAGFCTWDQRVISLGIHMAIPVPSKTINTCQAHQQQETQNTHWLWQLRFSVNFEMFKALIITTVWEITLGSSINFRSPHSHWMSNVTQFSEFHLSIL